MDPPKNRHLKLHRGQVFTELIDYIMKSDIIKEIATCSQASVHTSLITQTLKCERTHYNMLYCYALCTVLLY